MLWLFLRKANVYRHFRRISALSGTRYPHFRRRGDVRKKLTMAAMFCAEKRKIYFHIGGRMPDESYYTPKYRNCILPVVLRCLPWLVQRVVHQFVRPPFLRPVPPVVLMFDATANRCDKQIPCMPGNQNEQNNSSLPPLWASCKTTGTDSSLCANNLRQASSIVT
jgi:hypothetical protein